MFRIGMHILKSHTHSLSLSLTHAHTQYERNLHDWHQEKQEEITEDQCQRRHTKDH